MNRLVHIIVRKTLIQLAKQTVEDHLLALQEGHFKVEVANALLRCGCELQEGTSQSASVNGNRIPLADFVKLTGAVVRWSRKKRVLVKSGGSHDLIVTHPIQFCIELKTRPDYGSKAQAGFSEFAADLARIVGHSGIIFIAVLDEKMFRSFSGAKTSSRGRKPRTPQLSSLFPKLEEIPIDGLSIQESTWNGREVKNLFYRQQLASGSSRVLVAVIPE